MIRERLARAKVNLFLHVGAPGGDGYHPVASLMVFADIGDTVRLAEGKGPPLALEGPFAESLLDESDNLISRARDLLLGLVPERRVGFRLVLDKRLPIASGLGGGSADAAATFVLLRDALGLEVSDDGLHALAARLGSDVPACLQSRSVIATGRGEHLAAAPALPALDAVLVNPRLPSPTGAVYRAYDTAVHPRGANLPAWSDTVRGAEDVARWLATCRNDLQAPALALQPAIGEVLDTLGQAPETLMARMSGSGATCFALCRSAEEADDLARRLARERSGWWVRACVLGDRDPDSIP